jgi:hypothetical protein
MRPGKYCRGPQHQAERQDGDHRHKISQFGSSVGHWVDTVVTVINFQCGCLQKSNAGGVTILSALLMQREKAGPVRCPPASHKGVNSDGWRKRLCWAAGSA